MSNQNNGDTSQAKSNPNQQQSAKKNPGCGIVIAIVVFFIAFGIGRNICAQGLRDTSSSSAARDTQSLSDSAKEYKTVDCYEIKIVYYGMGGPFLPITRRQVTVYYCKLYTDAARSEDRSTYMEISKTDFERYFGPDAKGAGAAGTADGDYDDDESLSLDFNFGRSYTAPVRIRAEVVNATYQLNSSDFNIPLSFVSVEASP